MTQPLVGVVGLGLMGSAIARSLEGAGYRVLGHDTNAERVAEHRERGAEAAGSPAEVAGRAELVLLSLPTSTVVREVCLGSDGIAGGARPGTLVVDTTTGRPEDSAEVSRALSASGIDYIDACMSGNADQAAHRDLVAMVGGTSAGYERGLPLLEAIARSVHHLGPVGSGAQAKLAVNLVLGIHRMAIAEALTLGQKVGLDVALLLEVLKDGAAYSRAMDIWGPRMVAGDYHPPASRIRQSLKDFRLILEQGQRAGSPTPLGSTILQLLTIADATGLGDADNAGVAALTRRLAGIEPWPASGGA
ncbi:MAG: NAD-binding protein [Nitriliruptorales bacterium]|nr:NAD-binding protein [Nitriliruptorales bacterium]